MASLLPLTLTPATTMPRGRRNADIITTRKKNAVRALGQEVSDALHTLPYTTSEWTFAVADVKREYLNRRYRPCVAKCTNILDNVCESVSLLIPQIGRDSMCECDLNMKE